MIDVELNRVALDCADFIAPVNERDELVARVPGDMQNAVVMDNAKFRAEMEEWDKAHQLTSTDSTSTSSNTVRFHVAIAYRDQYDVWVVGGGSVSIAVE